MSTMNVHKPIFPQAPELQGELLLDVFTHRSLRQASGTIDNERYAVLGEKVLEAAITHCIFLRYPHYGRQEIEEERKKLLSDENYEKWTNHYRFREKIRYSASAVDEINSPQGARELFHAYIGGAFTQANGPMTVNSWVYLLVLPPEDPPNPGVKAEPSSPPLNPPYPVLSPTTHQPYGDLYSPHSRTSAFPTSRNVSVPSDDSLDGVPLNSTPGKSVYLPRFNEITTQLRLNVQYSAEQKGLQHAPRWLVKCLVDGQEMGIGAATTKQLAKEEAAKQAFHAMNFRMPARP